MLAAFRSARALRRALALFAALGAASACRPADEANVQNDAVPANAPAAETPSPAALPVAVLPLGRAELLAAIRAAADARASGQALPKANAALVGRSFELALPFGCGGPMGEDSEDWAGWTFDEDRQVLKLNAQVPITAKAEWLRDIAPDAAFDTVEGFWIERPWTSAETCPPPTPRAAGAPPARPNVAIAQFFAPDAPRTRQRSGRPYATTLRAGEVPADRSQGFQLAISGRIAAYEDGQPVHCRLDAADLPPVCVAAVEISHVAFRNAAGGDVLSEWDR